MDYVKLPEWNGPPEIETEGISSLHVHMFDIKRGGLEKTRTLSFGTTGSAGWPKKPADIE